jgi:hypothetical protein
LENERWIWIILLLLSHLLIIGLIMKLSRKKKN